VHGSVHGHVLVLGGIAGVSERNKSETRVKQE
jgi:hypothetical protein